MVFIIQCSLTNILIVFVWWLFDELCLMIIWWIFWSVSLDCYLNISKRLFRFRFLYLILQLYLFLSADFYSETGMWFLELLSLIFRRFSLNNLNFFRNINLIGLIVDSLSFVLQLISNTIMSSISSREPWLFCRKKYFFSSRANSAIHHLGCLC